MIKVNTVLVFLLMATVGEDIYSQQYLWPKSAYLRRYDKSRKTESLDLEEPDGEALRRHYLKPDKMAKLKKLLFDYTVIIAIGAVVGVVYSILSLGPDAFIEWRNEIFEELLAQNRTYAILAFGILVSSIVATIGSLGVFIEPCAAGNGMPEVEAYLNGAKLRKYNTWRTVLLKIWSSGCVAASGLFTGYDGPLTHVGCILGVLISKAARKVTRKLYEEGQETLEEKGVYDVLHKREDMQFAAVGTAAGMTAQGRAPLSGVLFALEEAISYFDPSIIFKTLLTSLSTYIVSSFIIQSAEGRALWSVEGFSMFPKDAECLMPVTFVDIAVYVGLGVINGVLGQMFNFAVIWVLKTRGSLLDRKPYLRMIEVIAAVCITMSVIVMVPSTFDRCVSYKEFFDQMKPVEESCFTWCNMTQSELVEERPECSQFVCLQPPMLRNYQRQVSRAIANTNDQCLSNATFSEPLFSLDALAEKFLPGNRFVINDDEECIYPLRTLFWRSSDTAVKSLFTRGAYSLFSVRDMLIYGGTYITLGTLTYNIMLPTDLITTQMNFGAVIGRLYGIAVNQIKGLLGEPSVDPGAMAVLGVISFWSGSSRITLAIAVMFLESTFDFQLLPGMVVVVLVSMIVGESLGETQSEMELRLRGLITLPDEAPDELKSKTVEEVMNPDIFVLREREKRDYIVKLLKSVTHHGFPVVKMIYPSFITQDAIKNIEDLENDEDSLWRLWNYDDESSSTKTKIARKNSKDSQSSEVTEKTLLATKPKRRLVGVITRKQLKWLLGIEKNVDLTPETNINEFVDNHKRMSDPECLNVSDLIQKDLDPDMMDLGPFMNQPPYIVRRTMSAHKAYLLCRKLGLRHLCVTDDEGDVVGIITRKDFDKAINPEFYEEKTRQNDKKHI